MIEFKITLTENVKGGIDYKTESPAATATPAEQAFANQLLAFIGEFEQWARKENTRPRIILPPGRG